MNDAAKSAMTMPAVLEKLNTLDRWITQRFDETRSAETRIASKLDQLTKLEGSLNVMIESLRRQVGDTLPVIHQINEAKVNASTTLAETRASLDDVLASARQTANQLSHETLDTLDAQLQERVRSGLKSVTHEHVVALNRDVQQALEDEASRGREQAEQTLILFRQRLAERLEQVRDEAHNATRPYTNRLAEARDHVDREIDAIIENAQTTLTARLEQLALSARGTTELLERECVSRVRSIRPQVMTEVEATQRSISHRVNGLIDQSRSMVDRVVGELDARLDALSPKTEAMRSEVDTKLNDFLQELQGSADTMLTWLEDRVTTRVDDLVDRSRRSMFAELRQLDDAAQTLARKASQLPPAAPVIDIPETFSIPSVDERNPLSLTMYLDRLKQATPGPKPAA